MGVETDRRGVFRLKPEVTMQDVAALWLGYDCVRDAEADLPAPDAVNYRPVDGEETADFNIGDGYLAYELYGYSGSFADEVDVWLKDAATILASHAWTDEDRSNDGYGDTVYGPSERARLEHRIAVSQATIEAAEHDLLDLQTQLDALKD